MSKRPGAERQARVRLEGGDQQAAAEAFFEQQRHDIHRATTRSAPAPAASEAAVETLLTTDPRELSTGSTSGASTRLRRSATSPRRASQGEPRRGVVSGGMEGTFGERSCGSPGRTSGSRERLGGRGRGWAPASKSIAIRKPGTGRICAARSDELPRGRTPSGGGVRIRPAPPPCACGSAVDVAILRPGPSTRTTSRARAVASRRSVDAERSRRQGEEQNGGTLIDAQQRHWWGKYKVGGQAVRVSTGCTERRACPGSVGSIRAGKIAAGEPLPVKLYSITYDELREDLDAAYAAKEIARAYPSSTGCGT